MAIETVRRNAKRYYEEFLLQSNNGIDKLLFRTEDMDTSAGLLLDRLITTPYSAVYREKSNQGHVAPYQGGSGTLYEPPITTEITPIPEDLEDAVIAGIEANSADSFHATKLMQDIVKQHTDMHNMLKWKQAIDVLFDGQFYAKGENGVDLGLGVDFGRAAGQSITYDFTAGGASMLEAIGNMVEQARATGTPMSGLCVLMGDDWISKFGTDTGILSYMQATQGAQLLQTNMMPQQLGGMDSSVYVLGQVRPLGAIAPVWVLGYNPGAVYKAYNGASSTDWITSTKAAMFSLSDPTYRAYRGVNVMDGGRKMRQVGELVFDSYVENNPVEERLRSNSRHLFVYGNINHTVVSTGTFS